MKSKYQLWIICLFVWSMRIPYLQIYPIELWIISRVKFLPGKSECNFTSLICRADVPLVVCQCGCFSSLYRYVFKCWFSSAYIDRDRLNFKKKIFVFFCFFWTALNPKFWFAGFAILVNKAWIVHVTESKVN